MFYVTNRKIAPIHQMVVEKIGVEGKYVPVPLK